MTPEKVAPKILERLPSCSGRPFFLQLGSESGRRVVYQGVEGGDSGSKIQANPPPLCAAPSSDSPLSSPAPRHPPAELHPIQ